MTYAADHLPCGLRQQHDMAASDPCAALVAYVADGRHVDADTGLCQSLVAICRELEVAPSCFDADAVRILTGASREELRGLPIPLDADGNPRPRQAVFRNPL